MPRRSDPEFRNFRKGMAFLSPWLIGFAAFTLLPMLLTFYYSLCDHDLLQSPPLYIGGENYRQLLHDGLFGRSLLNTAYFVAMAVPAAMLLSLGLALLLNCNIRGRGIYRTIVFLPSLIPVAAGAVLWNWMFNGQQGLINVLLAKIGIAGPSWLTDEKWAMPALALMSLYGVGYTVVIYLAGLQDVPRELYEAAEIDGAGPWRRLIHITLPMISPVIFFNLIMALIGVFQFPTAAYMMTGGGPHYATYFFTMYLYDCAFTYLRMGYASAMAIVQFAIILFLTALAFWSSRRWVHYQGNK